MSFTSVLSILKRVGTVALGVEHVLAPIAEVLVPTLAPEIAFVDAWVQKIQGKVQALEVQAPASGQGPSKLAATVADFREGIQFTQDILAMDGKALAWDQSVLEKAISDYVAALNGFAAVKSSFKIVPLVPPPLPVA